MIRVKRYEELKKENLDKEREEWEESIEMEVKKIQKEVKEKKDEAIIEFTKKFDGYDLTKTGFKLNLNEINMDEIKINDDVKKAIDTAIRRVEEFHKREYINSWFYINDNGSILGQILKPVENVGIYIPGGRAEYPSTIIMSVVPAKIAGVKNIYITTPPKDKFSNIFIYTLKTLSINEVFTIGGAQAIFALAYGTESIPKVDLIVGPGNIYTAIAKKIVYGDVGIDGINGPSEIVLWVIEENFDIKRIVCDFMAQLEHSPYDRGLIILNNENKVSLVIKEIEEELKNNPRRAFLEGSLNRSFIIIANIEEALDVINYIAPEHLEIISNNGEDYIPYIKNVGAIFINHSSVFGDYIAGPSHILPTGRRAIFSSGLSVNTFMKRISFIKLDKKDIKEISSLGSIIAREEGFFMHEKSLKSYMEEEKCGEK